MSETTTVTLTDFLLARIEEKEAAARDANYWADLMAALGGGPNARHGARHNPARVLADCEAKRRIVERASRPVYTFGPADPPSPFAELTFFGGRVYAAGEVDVTEAYQREVAAHSEPADPATLRDLAATYADHPDYREEWRP